MEDKQKDYEQLRKAHKLPEFPVMDKEFEISDCEHLSSIREARQKVADMICFAAELMEQMLQPDAGIASLYESRVFDDETKKQVFQAYRQLMKIKRQADILKIRNDEKQDALFISETLDSWRRLKPEVAGILETVKKSWSEDREMNDKLQYFG